MLVRFDEGNSIIKEVVFPKDVDELLFQLRNDDVLGRMDAAGALLRFKDDPRVLIGLEAGAAKDPFWAVRKSAVEALAAFPSPKVPILLKKSCLDPSSQVRAAAVLALGERKDPALAAFYQELFRKDASGRVQAEALRALGKTGDASVMPFLERSASVPSHQNMVKKAADSAIELLEKK